MPGTYTRNPCPEPIPGIRAQNLYPGLIRNNVFSISHIRGLWHGVKRCARTGRWNWGREPGPAQTEPGYLGLIRAEIRTSPDRDADHKVQADNIKRWGSISRPPPERLGMSGWERLSAEGRSKRLKIWSPGLPISNPTSCNYYPPAPRKESIENARFTPLACKVEPVPIHETSPDIEAPALP